MRQSGGRTGQFAGALPSSAAGFDMSAFDTLVTALVASGMAPSEAAALIARAVIEATAKSKTSGALRTARWRERHRASHNVIGASSPSTVTAASQASQNVTCDPTNATNAPLLLSSSFVSPKEEKKESDVVVLSPTPRARQKGGMRLRDDWKPSETDRQFAASRGLSPADIDTEATKFRNYWTNRTDRQAAKPRWDLAWQNWILNMRGTTNAKNNVLAASDNLVDRVRQFDQPAPGEQRDLRGGTCPIAIRTIPSR
jgi:hypothetical protein